METYITVSFWLSLASFIIRGCQIGVCSYPRKKEYSMGFDISVIILSLPLFVWVAYLKWFVI